ncbi:hypothetical protein RHOSPDRAFT_28818 [Rhodotorula sp. JG-1b]|nr:hypothetical protein RHOSPDRAFT_28818 [Rhodotorula sp. JG-1b]
MDRTAQFKELVQAKEQAYPPSKRQRVKFGHLRQGPDAPKLDPWTRQADQVATNLRSFANFLSSIRRAYLDLGSSTSSNAAAPPKRTLDPSKKGLAAWEGVRWLTDKERDEIDFAVKVALRKSVDRVRQLEQLEKARLEAEKRDNPSPTASGGALSRLLRLAPATSQDSAATTAAAEQALAQHRSLITFYLNALLADVSQRQRDQQEARVQRQLEKAQSLGALGANVGGPFGTDTLTAAAAAAAGGSGKGATTAPIPSTSSSSSSFIPGMDDDDDDDDDDNPLGSTLTAEQVQQFEAEESALLKATQTDLDALHKAESSLLEIAALQTQLVSHLTQQSELTDQLWEDAITVSGEVERGNKQLKQAKERSRDSRLWLLVFLFGSSFTLLFLDYYT